MRPEHILRARKALSALCEGIGEYCRERNGRPEQGSQAANELASYPDRAKVQSAQDAANLLIEFGAEQCFAYIKAITPPIEAIAAWGCVRGLLEPCALAAWLLDPSIDVVTRVSRNLALRYEGLTGMVKYARVAGYGDVSALIRRIDDVEREALGLGFQKVLDKRGRREGIGQRMPSATDVIGMMLDDEETYRLLSAVAHGHTWAICTLAFQNALEEGPEVLDGSRVEGRMLEKIANPSGIAFQALHAARALCRPVWYAFRYFGWDDALLLKLYESVFDELQAKPETRFWRAGS